MSEHLTPDQILEAAEDVLRRYGPAKANVVDIARALGVSHGSIYRHFPSKAALGDAVARRWLGRIMAPLTVIAEAPGPATERLRAWLDALIAAKHAKVLDDPELFATYTALAGEAREVVAEHVAALVAQIAAILADGVAQGEFEVADPRADRPCGAGRHGPLPQALPRSRLERSRHRRGLRGGLEPSAERAEAAGLRRVRPAQPRPRSGPG